MLNLRNVHVAVSHLVVQLHTTPSSPQICPLPSELWGSGYLAPDTWVCPGRPPPDSCMDGARRRLRGVGGRIRWPQSTIVLPRDPFLFFSYFFGLSNRLVVSAPIWRNLGWREKKFGGDKRRHFGVTRQRIVLWGHRSRGMRRGGDKGMGVGRTDSNIPRA